MEPPTCPRCGSHNFTRTGEPVEHTTTLPGTWQPGGPTEIGSGMYTAEFRCEHLGCGWHGPRDVPPPGH